MKYSMHSNTVEYLQAQNLVAPNAFHAFFTRKGGVSQGIYNSLNGGLGSADNKDHVLLNRERMAQVLDVPTQNFLSLYQIHSPTCLVVEKPWDYNHNPQADAMVTRHRNIALAVGSADCTPVLFIDPIEQVIGAAHSGWKGAKGGVLESTIKGMLEQGAELNNIRAAIGPHIRQISYEVSADFRTLFLEEDTPNDQFFIPAARLDHFYFDLSKYVVKRLTLAGIKNIEDCGLDTYAQSEYFFSHRRSVHNQEGDYGRLYSAIVLK